MGINVGDLAKSVNEILSEYADDVNEGVKVSAQEVGKQTVKQLRATSPKPKGRKAKYARSWRQKTTQDRLGNTQTIVYNDKHWRLTHLLENGHFNRDGSFTKGRPHIKPAEDMAVEAFVKEVEKNI